MRKWALRAGVFILTLVVGLGSSFFLGSYQPLSFCDIDANPAKYQGRIVRVRVLVNNPVFASHPKRDGLLFVPFCCDGGNAAMSMVSIDLDPAQLSLLPETRFRSHGDSTRQDGKSYLTEAIMTGKFRQLPGSHCFGIKYNLSPARIERVIATHEFENDEQAAQWLKSNSR